MPPHVLHYAARLNSGVRPLLEFIASMLKPAPLCEDLERVLTHELHAGNVLIYGPAIGDWPDSGSVFAQLKNDFAFPVGDLPEFISQSICNDPHYGWYYELACTNHSHVLVAGPPRPGKPMWAKV